MGKRKSSSKPQGPKKVRPSQTAVHGAIGLTWASQRDPLPDLFPCLFCNHEDAVKPVVDKKLGIGSLSCKVCGQTFQCSINCKELLHSLSAWGDPILTMPLDLSAPVDVYSEWVDAAGAYMNLLLTPIEGLAAGSRQNSLD